MSFVIHLALFFLLMLQCAVPSLGQAGGACTGKWFGSSGNCSTTEVYMGESNTHVKTYCYAPTASNMGNKAGRSLPGTCYVPRYYTCDSDSQCRPGTRCVPKGEKLICDLDSFQPGALDLDTALQLVREQAQYLSRAFATVEGGFADTKSGVLSPLLAATGIPAEQRASYVQDLASSFESGKLKDMGDTSRSGATFIFSGDYKFIAKTVRPEEFTVWAEELLPLICGNLPLQQPCEGSGIECSWPWRVVSATTLNVPVMGFKRDNSHFLILPTVDSLRRAAQATPLVGEAKLFDVKPLRAHSHERKAFLEWIADTQSFPARGSAPQATQSQWRSLLDMMYDDMALLDSAAIVDYSILAEVYEQPQLNSSSNLMMNADQPWQREDKTIDPGPQCVSLAGCFEDIGQPCRVLCMSIIDYTLKYDTAWKALESQVIRNKWDDYSDKAMHFANCIGDMGFGAPNAQRSVFRLHDKEEQQCQSYADIVCGGDSWTFSLQNCSWDPVWEWREPSGDADCSDPRCIFQGYHADICHPFQAATCKARIVDASVLFYIDQNTGGPGIIHMHA